MLSARELLGDLAGSVEPLIPGCHRSGGNLLGVVPLAVDVDFEGVLTQSLFGGGRSVGGCGSTGAGGGVSRRRRRSEQGRRLARMTVPSVGRSTPIRNGAGAAIQARRWKASVAHNLRVSLIR